MARFRHAADYDAPSVSREDVTHLWSTLACQAECTRRLILTAKRLYDSCDWYEADRRDAACQVLEAVARQRGWTADRLEAVIALMDADVIFSPSDTSFSVIGDGELDVNVNDTFFWGTADCEPISAADAVELRAVFDEFGHDGVTAWVALRRGSVWPINLTDEFQKAYDALKARKVGANDVP